MRALKRAVLVSVVLPFLALVLLAARPASAQSVVGSIFGTVEDQSAGNLPGVTVTVSSPQLIAGQQVVTTTENGSYRVSALPPGTYTVTFELSGFQTLKRTGIVLQAGQSLPVDVQLAIATLAETLTVSGEASVIDTRNSALVNVLGSEGLENLPLARSYVYMLNIMPGVSDAKYLFTPINVVHGGSVRQNEYSLDGFKTNDSNTGSSGTDLPVDAIQEVQLTTAGVPAEFAEGSGAVFTFVSKSGGDIFNGGASFFAQGRKTQSNNIDDDLRRQGLTSVGGFEHVYDSSGFMGGPVKKGKVWFFGVYRYLNLEEKKSDFPSPMAHNDHQLFGKGSVQISKGQTAEVSYHMRDKLNYPYTARANFRTAEDPRTWSGLRSRTDMYTGRWSYAMNNKSLVEARVNMFMFYNIGESPNNDGSPAYQEIATGVLSGGTDLMVGPTDRNREQLKVDYSRFQENWLGRSHNFKGGVAWQSTPNLASTFVLGARSDSELVGCDGCVSRVPDALHQLSNNQPFRVQLYNAPTERRFEFRTLSGYIQDQWVLTDNVTLNVGARIDSSSGVNNESSSGGGAWETKATFPEATAVKFTTIAPRIGMVWDVAKDHKTIVKGSAGRFYAESIGTWLRDTNPATFGFREYDWVDANGDRMYQAGEETLLRRDTRPDPTRLPKFDDNFKNQRTDVYTIGIERRLSASWAFTATGIFKRDGDLVGIVDEVIPFSAYNAITVNNLLTGQPMTIYTLRQEFVGARGQIVATNPGERPGDTEPLVRRYNGLELVVTKQMTNNWQLQSSYVYGRATGNVSNSFAGSTWAEYISPNLFVNRFGALPLDQPHQFKLYGSYIAPRGVVLSASFQAGSGLPLTDSTQGFVQEAPKGSAIGRFTKAQFPQIISETFIDVALEPAGTRRFEKQVNLDFRVEKRFDIGVGHLAVAADLFNLLNDNAVVRVRDVRLDSPNYLLPAEIVAPRQFRFGLKWDF